MGFILDRNYHSTFSVRCVALVALMLCGCTETRIYENGQLVLAMQGDATNVTFRTGRGTYFHADTINHSAATAAAYTGGTALIGGIGSAVAGAALGFK